MGRSLRVMPCLFSRCGLLLFGRCCSCCSPPGVVAKFCRLLVRSAKGDEELKRVGACLSRAGRGKCTAEQQTQGVSSIPISSGSSNTQPPLPFLLVVHFVLRRHSYQNHRNIHLTAMSSRIVVFNVRDYTMK